MTTSLKVQALLSWLASGAPPRTNYTETVAEIARRLVGAGVEVDLFVLYQKPKNPLASGKRFVWSSDGGMYDREFTHADFQSPIHVDSVVDVARTTERPVRYRIGNMPEFDAHPGSKRLIDSGFTEFTALPLIAINEENALLGIGVKRAGGLSDEQFEICRRIAAPLARVVESHVREESASSLLATFLGRDAGARVNAGMVRRGDAEMIRAVILFTDIDGFTEQSNRLPISETVGMLNRYFEALEQPVVKNGGDVLKLMGDGMLAIFPTPHDLTAEEGAAFSALSAVEDARAELAAAGTKFRAAYHVGEIHYGNIGGLTRLDFTAIGPAVNITSRLLGAASQQGVEAVCSAAFAELVPDRVNDLGFVEFKGFATPQQVYAVS